MINVVVWSLWWQIQSDSDVMTRSTYWRNMGVDSVEISRIGFEERSFNLSCITELIDFSTSCKWHHSMDGRFVNTSSVIILYKMLIINLKPGLLFPEFVGLRALPTYNYPCIAWMPLVIAFVPLDNSIKKMYFLDEVPNKNGAS